MSVIPWRYISAISITRRRRFRWVIGSPRTIHGRFSRRTIPIGSVVTAKIVGMTAFGAFAQIIPGIDGLIHISQIADRRIDKPQDELKMGQEVQVKITNVDYENKRISLSIRALLEDAEAAGATEAPTSEEAQPAEEETPAE